MVGTTLALTTDAAGSSSSIAALPPLSAFITIKLGAGNFLLWKVQVTTGLCVHNAMGYVDGSIPAPPQMIVTGPNPTYTTWFRQDKLVLGALLSSMTEEILGQVMNCTTAAQVWAALNAMFASSNRVRVNQIRTQLSNLKKKDMTATDYFNKMKSLADTMESIGKPLDDEDIMGFITGGLGSEYDPLVAAVNTSTTVIPLGDFFSYLLSFEQRLEQHSAQ